MIKLIKPICPVLYKLLIPECCNGKCPEGKLTCGRMKEKQDFFKNL